jgi:hypothetical protein
MLTDDDHKGYDVERTTIDGADAQELIHGNQGQESYQKKPVLEPESFTFWEPGPKRTPNFN